MKDLKAKFHVPLYQACVTLLICQDIKRGAWKHFRHNMPDHFEAASFYQGNSYAMIFSFKEISFDNVCHELYHVTCRIMETMKTKAGPRNHEPYAYVQGYVGGRVLKQLAKWKLKLK